MSTSHAQPGAVLPPPTMDDLGHGFHAFVQLDGSWGLNNAGVFVGADGVVLVDTAFTAHRGRALREAVGRLTDKPVRTVVNTHHHGDHTYGNFLFPGATVIGHNRCREATIATGFETKKWFPGVDWGDIRISPPTVTFADSLTVWCDDLPASLRFVGPAHTSNDVIVWVEEHRLLFAGDLVFNGGTPFVVMGSVEGILRALEQLDALDAEVVVPGHGAVCGPEVIGRQRDYLRFVQERAREGFAAGVEPLELGRRTDLGEFAGWTDAERLVGNFHRAYAELRGEPAAAPLDYDRVVDDMIAFNGGRPLHCVA
jgi:cyclase